MPRLTAEQEVALYEKKLGTARKKLKTKETHRKAATAGRLEAALRMAAFHAKNQAELDRARARIEDIYGMLLALDGTQRDNQAIAEGRDTLLAACDEKRKKLDGDDKSAPEGQKKEPEPAKPAPAPKKKAAPTTPETEAAPAQKEERPKSQPIDQRKFVPTECTFTDENNKPKAEEGEYYNGF